MKTYDHETDLTEDRDGVFYCFKCTDEGDYDSAYEHASITHDREGNPRSQNENVCRSPGRWR
jgi:hypothetical protein